MKLNVKLTDGAELPKHAKPGDAGIDLTSRETVVLNPGETKLVSTGVAIQLPAGYVGLVFPRSGLGAKGVNLSNCVGVIDSGYRGEIKVALHNNHPVVDWEHPSYDSWHDVSLYRKTMTIVRGDRVCQLVVVPVETVECVAVDKLDDSERGQGGFGSSGVR